MLVRTRILGSYRLDLEHGTNAEFFSPSFAIGSPQGFWWAVVSLTTVGYGDKIPGSIPGRLFSIIWILVGAIMLSLFTAMVTNAMNTAMDGSKCKDISGKEVGVFIKNTETQLVAKQYEAKIIEFSSLEVMQEKLSEGTIGRVLIDRNTAFYFLDKSGLKKNRQIRMIRNIDYPMEFYMAHVYTGPVNITNDSDPEIATRKKIVECGPAIKSGSTILLGESKEASGELIPAELQTADLFDQMDGLFSSGSEMTRFILFTLLGIFLGLVIIGIFWEGLNSCNPAILKRKNKHKNDQGSEKDHPGHFNRKRFVVENFQSFENRLRELSNDLQKTKEEFAKALLIQDNDEPHELTFNSALMQ
ncbi:Potassium voltage-gated channel subfamily G member 3 [Stylophora pistillata]|uniref:Potassium voltage-gated channel subfamily G member 3 n=2 Tax=Stylophora pistillata TaxID=50429 RepID=A0A2B4SC51_STYPI|nr:Potassium voltage-gated channel subfamily G member 3 [Stylophora pistillata]